MDPKTRQARTRTAVVLSFTHIINSTLPHLPPYNTELRFRRHKYESRGDCGQETKHFSKLIPDQRPNLTDGEQVDNQQTVSIPDSGIGRD